MALHEAHVCSESRPLVVDVLETAEVAVRLISHGTLAVCIVHVPPDLHSSVSELIVLVIHEMLKDNYSIRICSLDRIVVACKDVHTRLVVCRILSALISQSLCQVEAEAVHMVFLDEVLQAAVYMFLDHSNLVVEVLVHSEAVRCHDIVPRVVG